MKRSNLKWKQKRIYLKNQGILFNLCLLSFERLFVELLILRKMLESKAKYYEDIVAGKKVSGNISIIFNYGFIILLLKKLLNVHQEEGDEEIFLVDFDIKKSEATTQQSEETKGFRLKNELSEEEYNERLKQKWQKDAEANLEKSSVHYQDIRFDGMN
jgi:hypothetical protein